jgi:hypothetical protein
VIEDWFLNGDSPLEEVLTPLPRHADLHHVHFLIVEDLPLSKRRLSLQSLLSSQPCADP